MLTIISVLVVFSVLIIVHEAGHLVAAKTAGVRVDVFSLGFGKRIFGLKKGDTDYRVSLFPFGGYVKMAGEDPSEGQGLGYELSSKPVGARFWVITSGAITNYIFAFLLFWVIFMIGVPTLSNEVGHLLKGYPAEKAGIETGDVILSVSGRDVSHWDDIVEEIGKTSSAGGPLIFRVSRDGEILLFDIEPDISTVTNIFGQTVSRPMVGIGPRDKVLSVSYGPLEAFYHGGKRLLFLSATTYRGIWLLVTGGMPVKSSVSGPIGIMHIMGEAAKVGLVPLLIITAQVSMALAVFNLLPFPVLDGGHVIFLAIEKIKGKPVSARTQEMVTQAALVLLVAFVLFVSWQDLLKFTPLGGR